MAWILTEALFQTGWNNTLTIPRRNTLSLKFMGEGNIMFSKCLKLFLQDASHQQKSNNIYNSKINC